MHRPAFNPDSPQFSNDDPTWGEEPPMMDIADALEIVLRLARRAAGTSEELEAVSIVEDMAVNQFGDD